MRLRKTDLPDIFLVTAVPLLACTILGFFGTFFVVIVLLASRQCLKFLEFVNDSTRYPSDYFILESIPFSHYVEKVRWCMDIVDAQYWEEQDVGILGLLLCRRAVPCLKTPSKSSRLYNSSDILRYLYSFYLGQYPQRASFLAPTPAALEMEAKIDQFGIDARSYYYYHTLRESPMGNNACALKLWGHHSNRIPKWQKIILKVFVPLIRLFLLHTLGCRKREAANDSLERVRAFWSEMDGRLETMMADGQRYLLGTQYPTYVDVSLAAVASLLVMPNEVEGATEAVDSLSRPLPTDGSSEFQNEVARLRATATGQFVLRMYREHRGEWKGSVERY